MNDIEEYQPRSGGKSVSYEHCDVHDCDATNGCPKCEEIEAEGLQFVGPLAREVESIEFCLTTLAEQRDEEHRVAEMHWAAYCGADGQLQAAQERERIAHDYRARAEESRKSAELCAEAQMNASLTNYKLLHEKKLELGAVIDELADVRAVLARATRQGDLADELHESLAETKEILGRAKLGRRIAEAHDVDKYQRDAGLTATNIPNRQTEILVRCLKLASEAGELADIVGSAIEGSAACDLASMRARVEGELGDVLWYAARIATLFDLKLSEVTTKNLAKVKARVADGYWQGTGCEFCGNLVNTVPEPNECPFCGAK